MLRQPCSKLRVVWSKLLKQDNLMPLSTLSVIRCGYLWPISLFPIQYGSWSKNGSGLIISPQSCLMQSNWSSLHLSSSILSSTSPGSNSITVLWRGNPPCNWTLLWSLRIAMKNIRWITLLLLMLNGEGLSTWYIGKVGMTWTGLGNSWPIYPMPERLSQIFMLSILWHLVPYITWPIQSFSASSQTSGHCIWSFLQLSWTLSLETGG